MANYGKNRYYIIESIEYDYNIDTFTFSEPGSQGTPKVFNLASYYKDTYDIVLQYKKQPLIKAVSTRTKASSVNTSNTSNSTNTTNKKEGKTKKDSKAIKNSQEEEQKKEIEKIMLVPELMLMSGLPEDFD